MKSFSIRYLDAMGRTVTTGMMSFENDVGAVEYAREVQARHAITEVWCDDALVVRLFRYAAPPLDQTSVPSLMATAAFFRADVSRCTESSE